MALSASYDAAAILAELQATIDEDHTVAVTQSDRDAFETALINM